MKWSNSYGRRPFHESCMCADTADSCQLQTITSEWIDSQGKNPKKTPLLLEYSQALIYLYLSRVLFFQKPVLNLSFVWDVKRRNCLYNSKYLRHSLLWMQKPRVRFVTVSPLPAATFICNACKKSTAFADGMPGVGAFWDKSLLIKGLHPGVEVRWSPAQWPASCYLPPIHPPKPGGHRRSYVLSHQQCIYCCLSASFSPGKDLRSSSNDQLPGNGQQLSGQQKKWSGRRETDTVHLGLGGNKRRAIALSVESWVDNTSRTWPIA